MAKIRDKLDKMKSEKIGLFGTNFLIYYLL